MRSGGNNVVVISFENRVQALREKRRARWKISNEEVIKRAVRKLENINAGTIGVDGLIDDLVELIDIHDVSDLKFLTAMVVDAVDNLKDQLGELIEFVNNSQV